MRVQRLARLAAGIAPLGLIAANPALAEFPVGKDRVLLPPRYAAAGVPELWLVDVRRGLRFELHVLGPEGYRLLEPDADGWLRSPLVGPVRLRRERKRPDRWSYRLDVGEE